MQLCEIGIQTFQLKMSFVKSYLILLTNTHLLIVCFFKEFYHCFFGICHNWRIKRIPNLIIEPFELGVSVLVSIFVEQNYEIDVTDLLQRFG